MGDLPTTRPQYTLLKQGLDVHRDFIKCIVICRLHNLSAACATRAALPHLLNENNSI